MIFLSLHKQKANKLSVVQESDNTAGSSLCTFLYSLPVLQSISAQTETLVALALHY